MAFCTNCGTQLPDGSRFCGNCGAQLGGAAPAPQMNQPMAPGMMQKNGITFTKADEIDFEIFG